LFFIFFCLLFELSELLHLLKLLQNYLLVLVKDRNNLGSWKKLVVLPSQKELIYALSLEFGNIVVVQDGRELLIHQSLFLFALIQFQLLQFLQNLVNMALFDVDLWDFLAHFISVRQLGR